MRLSLNWLADFVDLTLEAQALADRLTMAGLEVEAVEEVAPEFSGVVVGKVLNVERHPQADRLQVAEVTTGSQTYRVVCGAPNVAAGVLYPFAPPGPSWPAATSSRPPSSGASSPKACSWRKMSWACPPITWV